jgi:retinoid hydroxylase
MTDKLKPADMMPGSKGLPIIGEVVDLLVHQEEFYWQHYHKYGNIFKISMPWFGKCACLVGPEANRLVLKDRADQLSSRLGNQSLEPILSNDTVLLQDGEQHRTNRKRLLPAFHHQVLTSYVETVRLVVSKTVDDWGKQGTINLDTELRKLTLCIVIKTFLGCEQTEEIDRVSEWFATLVQSLRGIIKWDIPLTAYGRGRAARHQIVAYVQKIIRERIERGELEQSTDILGLLLNTVDEDGNKFTQTQIVNQVIGILFAGYETTTSLMNWVLFELGNRPEWRQKLRDEYQQVLGSAPMSMTHLRQLPLLTNVLKESERLYPPAIGLIRGVIEDIDYKGYLIPAGWCVLIFPMLTHRLPEIYQEPDLFDPNRFAPPREEDKKYSYSLIGFGGGLHSCIGMEFAQMEMKIILSTLLQKYDWSVIPTVSEITPLRRPTKMQTKLRAKLVPLH